VELTGAAITFNLRFNQSSCEQAPRAPVQRFVGVPYFDAAPPANAKRRITRDATQFRQLGISIGEYTDKPRLCGPRGRIIIYDFLDPFFDTIRCEIVCS